MFLLVFINGEKKSDMINTCLMAVMGKKGVSGVGNLKKWVAAKPENTVTDDWSKQFDIKKYNISGIYQISAFSSL